MKNLIFIGALAVSCCLPLYAQQIALSEQEAPSASAVQPVKVILLISEQNIEGPQTAWWVSEIDLSTVEANIAGKLIEQGYEVLEPSALANIVKVKAAFRLVDISEEQSLDLGKASRADYIVLGKAVASAGGNVPQSSMHSCFANVIAKLIRVKDSKVVQCLDASASSAHTDVVTGGREALAKAAETLAQKIIEALRKEGGK
jgi:hypothetical protein